MLCTKGKRSQAQKEFEERGKDARTGRVPNMIKGLVGRREGGGVDTPNSDQEGRGGGGVGIGVGEAPKATSILISRPFSRSLGRDLCSCSLKDIQDNSEYKLNP